MNKILLKNSFSVDRIATVSKIYMTKLKIRDVYGNCSITKTFRGSFFLRILEIQGIFAAY